MSTKFVENLSLFYETEHLKRFMQWFFTTADSLNLPTGHDDSIYKAYRASAEFQGLCWQKTNRSAIIK